MDPAPIGQEERGTPMTEPPFTIEPLVDQTEMQALLSRRWGDTLMMFGRAWKIGDYAALVARDRKGEALGLATYALQKATMLVLTVDNFSETRGLGKALLEAVEALARQQGARALRVLTTNDNTPAIRYFQKLGFKMVAFYPGAITIYRTVARDLPEIGVDGIPVRDAIELEIDL
jgi:ribosomal protein S18 acetylase RimI-like enzyme